MLRPRAGIVGFSKWWYGDREWFAVDAAGHLGAFITAGEGDFPTNLLTRYTELEHLAEDIEALPKVGDCHLLHRYPKPDDFIGYANRGVYAFDWMEIHMPSHKKNHYYLISQPQMPLLIGDLSPSLQASFLMVHFNNIEFAKISSFSIREYIDDVIIA